MFGLPPLPRTLPAALRDAGHAKVDVRVSAMRDLARLVRRDADRTAIATLAQTLTKDKEAPVRAAAALALADAGVDGALPALFDAVSDEHVQVRENALIALGESGLTNDARLEAVLETALADKAPAVRFQALIALHRVAGAAAEGAVLKATRDPDPELRQIAFRLAEELIGPGSQELPELLKQRARAALRDDAPGVRLGAAILLARVGDASGKAVISAVVRREFRVASFENEQAAIELAGELGLTDTQRALERRAFGLFGLARDPLAWHARVALARLGDVRARTAILRGLSAFSRDTRSLAVAAAGRARLAEARPILGRMTLADADPDTLAEALAELDGVT